jgi:hypothetical protein
MSVCASSFVGGLIKVEETSVSLQQLTACIGRSLAGIAGSNPGGSKDVCIFGVLCVVRVMCIGLITRPELSYPV